MQLSRTSYTVTVIFILLPVILCYKICLIWTIYLVDLLLVSYLVNIPYQRDHNGNKQDISAFCAIFGYIYAVLELGGFVSQFAMQFHQIANQFSKWFAVLPIIL